MREFIDKSTVNISKTIGGQNDFANCIRDAVRAVINNTETVTEHEIVKPYFEQLKEEINAYKEVHDNYCENIENGDFWANHTSDHYISSGGKATACDAILGMIDKILSE